MRNLGFHLGCLLAPTLLFTQFLSCLSLRKEDHHLESSPMEGEWNEGLKSCASSWLRTEDANQLPREGAGSGFCSFL